MMKSSFHIMLMLNAVWASTQISHEFRYFIGCYEHGTTEVHYEFENEEMLYVDFEGQAIVYTIPPFIDPNPSTLFSNRKVYKEAMQAKRVCSIIFPLLKTEIPFHEEGKDPPESVLYPADEVQPGLENSLICFVNYFYPPDVRVHWTKNGLQVSEGVSVSRYYPNEDQTFRMFSLLKFIPREGDIYSCSVEHLTLQRPQTKFWEPEVSHPSKGPDVLCGVGLTVAFLGVAVGTFLTVKGHHRQNSFSN